MTVSAEAAAGTSDALAAGATSGRLRETLGSLLRQRSALIGLSVLIAFALLERRDLGAGVLPSRPGPARGSLRTVGGLTRRLARGRELLGWRKE